MKKSKKPMNPMEAYRKKNKEKEKSKHKTHRKEQKDSHQRFEGADRPPNTNLQHYDGDNLSEGFEGEEDLMQLNTVQQLLQKKQMMREGKYDSASSVNANIQDLMQTFSKGPGSGSAMPKKAGPAAPPQTTQNQAQPTSNISSFMSENIFRNIPQRTTQNPNPMIPSSVRQNNPTQSAAPVKTNVGDKRLQRQEANRGNLDPFMMTTMQGDYNPAQRNKINEVESTPTQSNYVSSAPGVYQAQPQRSSGPTVIVKEAALTSAPLRSQMEREKSSLVPINVLRKKPAPTTATNPEKEEAPKISQSTANVGIRNITGVPMPSMNFGFAQNVQQKPSQNDTLSAFLSEISKLDEDS